MSHIKFLNSLYEEAKQNYLIDEITRDLQIELKGLVAFHGETIKDIEKEISYLKGEIANTNQLLSNLNNKKSMCFIQGDGDAFLRKPTEESNGNIEFVIDTPPYCLTTPLNSINCDEGNDLLKTKLDDQYTDLQSHFHYANYTVFIRGSNNFE